MKESLEKYVGIDGYSSITPGFKGSIKNESSDFVVEEIPLSSITASEAGKYLYLKVKLTDWDTNKFLVRMSRDLHISRKRISYAGTKDKRGVTVQYFCINAPVKADGINVTDVEVLESFRSNHFLKLGDLVGNRFTIRIESDSDHEEEIRKIHSEVMEKGGFPNFFGMQRFGSMRVNTHKIGRHIIHGNYRKAVETYIYDPEFDSEEYRVNFGKTQDVDTALSEFPLRLNFERSLLGYIKEKGDYDGAFSAFPKNLGMLFVHAYQSYLFNRILSARLNETGNLLKASPGDIACAVDQYSNPVSDEEIKVNSFNTEKINRMAIEGKIRITAPLFGSESKFTRSFQGEIEREIFEEEGLDFTMFRVGGYPELSSKGTRRIIAARPLDFQYSGNNTVKFSLGRGIYATSFLREFTKNLQA